MQVDREGDIDKEVNNMTSNNQLDDKELNNVSGGSGKHSADIYIVYCDSGCDFKQFAGYEESLRLKAQRCPLCKEVGTLKIRPC